MKTLLRVACFCVAAAILRLAQTVRAPGGAVNLSGDTFKFSKNHL
jgi:hypothetical protein